ncbi:hypothetical protein AB0M32_46025 [Streptomyces sp. NPDC051985]|uniref:hypothetical protein n=1 Tax=Streptomyces sp. NPDC051985 TaxID=3155807 RepID=UPI00343FCC4F
MRRALSVHFTPCALFVAGVFALVRAGSFSGPSDWRAVWPERPMAELALIGTVSVCAALLSLLLQPFQVRAVRVLEGYWDRWSATARLAGVLAEVQRRRYVSLREKAAGIDPVAVDARRRLAARPPVEVLLPTALGNALRAGELSAGERYGLTTLSSWPRIHMQVSPRMSEALRSTRDALDTAVNLCWSFLALTVVLAFALCDEPRLIWLPLGSLVVSAIAYKGAVIAAQAYSGLMHVVFDLHRFDLLEALHHPLPVGRKDEEHLFGQVSRFFAGSVTSDLPYEHGDRGSGPHDADSAAEA